MLRTPPAPFGTQATRLHGGRIVLVVGTLLGLAFAGWVWIFHKGASTTKVATESATAPGWTAAQLHYEKPEVKAEAPAPKPVDDTAAKLAAMLAKLTAMQQELDELKKRKPTTTVVQQPPPPTPAPLKPAPSPMLFVSHDAITDQQGVAGLSGDINTHWGRLLGAVFIGGALRGGTQALTTAMAGAAGAGQIAAGYSGVVNQAMNPRIGRALDTRPTITVD